MISYARLTPGHGFEPGHALLYYLQRLACLPSLRRAMSGLIATMINVVQGAPKPRRLDPTSKGALSDLHKHGVVRLEPLADDAQMQAMHDYFMPLPLVGPGGREVFLDALPEGVASACYDLKTVVDCPGLMQIVNSPQILDIATAYIGCKPTLSSIGVRWSFPEGEKPAHFQDFHRDVDDWRFLKLFVYLTDVDEDSGPHCYIRTSHRRGFSWRARRYAADAVAAKYGHDKFETITGRRGATFLADTVGIHRGGAVNRTPRLILQAQYSILPVFALHYAPASFAAAAMDSASALDAYINRLLISPI